MDQEYDREGSLSTQPSIETVRQELSVLIQGQVYAHSINEREALLLTLRLGLIDGKCVTLQEAGSILHISPEWVRQRQYFLLKKKINDPRFFLKLKEYSRLIRLPRGIILHKEAH